MKALLRFDLDDPEDERQHRYALAGRDALVALDVLREEIRLRLKHAELGDEATRELTALRELIPHELVELLA
jgi:hypothetical protein